MSEKKTINIIKRFDISKSPWIKLERIIYNDRCSLNTDQNNDDLCDTVSYEESDERGFPLNLGNNLKYYDVFSRRSTNPHQNYHSATSIAFGYRLDKKISKYVVYLSVVEQYRASVNNYMLEFPGGICDSGESVHDCALRELREETGYTGFIIDNSIYLPTSALCNDNTFLATILIDLDSDVNENPKQSLDPTEDIVSHMFPVSNLLKTLIDYSRRNGSLISENLYVFAYALSLFPNELALEYLSNKIKEYNP